MKPAPKPFSAVRSTYTRQPTEKITLGEAQAVVNAAILDARKPLLWGVKWALILSAAAFLASVLSLILVLR